MLVYLILDRPADVSCNNKVGLVTDDVDAILNFPNAGELPTSSNCTKNGEIILLRTSYFSPSGENFLRIEVSTCTNLFPLASATWSANMITNNLKH